MSALIRHYLTARASAGLGTRILWWAVPICAVVTAVVTLVWVAPLLPHALDDGLPLPRKLHGNTLHPGFVSIHALMAAFALLIGFWQLSGLLRAAQPRLHRWFGRSYVGFVFLSAPASLVLVPRVDTFGVPYLIQAGALLWLTFTILGVAAIRRHDVAAHRRWMLRSYSLFWAAGVIPRLVMWIGHQFDFPPAYSYPASLWLAYGASMLFVETMLRRSSQRASGLEQPRRARSAGLAYSAAR